jgi:hypothetical protein
MLRDVLNDTSRKRNVRGERFARDDVRRDLEVEEEAESAAGLTDADRLRGDRVGESLEGCGAELRCTVVRGEGRRWPEVMRKQMVASFVVSDMYGVKK